jgi:hypothetical protein
MLGYVIQLAGWFFTQVLELFAGPFQSVRAPYLSNQSARIQFGTSVSQLSAPQASSPTEKLTLEVGGTERKVMIYQGDITNFTGDAIVTSGATSDIKIIESIVASPGALLSFPGPGSNKW